MVSHSHRYLITRCGEINHERRPSLSNRCDRLRNVLIPLGEHERILQYLRKADGLANVHGAQRRLGRVFSYMTRRFLHMGDYDQTIALGERAQAIAVTLGDFG